MTEPPFDIGRESDGLLVPTGDLILMEGIDAHCTKFLGPCDIVFHEFVSDLIHLDLVRYPPTEERRCWTFVTTGIAEKPMQVPERISDRESKRYVELMLQVPVDWPFDDADQRAKEQFWWPFRTLKQFARLPHEQETWIGPGHTMASDPPEPLGPGTDFCAAMLWPSFHMPQEFQEFELRDGRRGRILSLAFLYKEELEIYNRDGSDALLDRMDEAELTEDDLFVLNLSRRNAGRH